MKEKHLLDRIEIRKPCSESWDEMVGNGEVRFCSHCSNDVYDLSSMTRARAEKLVRESNGRMCVRYAKDTRGRIITESPTFTQIKRQATFAAGVLAGSLALTTLTYAQGEPVKAPAKASIKGDRFHKETDSDTSRFSGIVQDINGAVISGAIVSLINRRPVSHRETRTNADGYFEFDHLDGGSYQLEITSPGFALHLVENLVIADDLSTEKPFIVTLESLDFLTGVVVVADEPITTEQNITIHSEIQPRVLDKKEPKKKNNLPN